MPENIGHVIQISGPAVDVQFTEAAIPLIYTALRVVSDGFTCRIANLTGCPCTATVTSYGSGYVQATTTITATPGNSTWLPIVGGQLGFGTVVTANSGGGYGIAPEVFIPAPPPAQNNSNGVGGRQATGWVSISGGTVNGFTFTDPGAGYNSALTVALVPSPNDPNLATGVTAATLAFTLTKTDSITGVLCTNSGAALSDPNQITLTVTGAGSTATLTPATANSARPCPVMLLMLISCLSKTIISERINH